MVASSSFILVCVFTGECGVCATHTLPSFPAYVVARITEALVSGCHLRDREAMPSPRGIVGIHPLGPRGPRLPYQARLLIAPVGSCPVAFFVGPALSWAGAALGEPSGSVSASRRLFPRGSLSWGGRLNTCPFRGTCAHGSKRPRLVITHFLSRGTALSRSRWPDHFATRAGAGDGGAWLLSFLLSEPDTHGGVRRRAARAQACSRRRGV